MLYSIAQILFLAFQLAAPAFSFNWTDEPTSLKDVDLQISQFLEQPQASLSVQSSVFNNSTKLSGCALNCAFLDAVTPGEISYPESPIYQSESQYWSAQQASVLPVCRYSPTKATHVSIAILAARVTECQFSVKSGGHAAFHGASNIQDGITIDLVKLNEIAISSDRLQTRVGAGNRWIDVYSKLVPEGLAVIGGRVPDIGAGGFTLGGGISFFSARYGWACDNVITYELVTADGQIRQVNQDNYPDLFFALRGGGNNFGVVTTFVLNTIAQGDMWAGGLTYVLEGNDTAIALNDAFSNLNIRAPLDPFGQVILPYAFSGAAGLYFAVPTLQYGKPIPSPPIFENFTAVPGAIQNDLRITNLTNLTMEFGVSNPIGFRETYWTLTVKNDAPLMLEMIEIYRQEVDRIKDAANLTASIVFQPINIDIISHSFKNGGNALGLTEEDGPLNLINIAISWSSIDDDIRIKGAARNIIDRINVTAHAQGLGHRFLYQNYASEDQAVFQGYGEENLDRLKSIQKKYDPESVFTNLQPGYFKL